MSEPDLTAWRVDGTKATPTDVDNAYFFNGTDVAALGVDKTGVALSTSPTDELERGQPLIEVGNPSGVGNWVISLGRYLGGTDGEADDFFTSMYVAAQVARPF